MVYCYQRGSLAGSQYHPIMGHVAGQSLDTVRITRVRSRLHSLVLVRPYPASDIQYELALRSVRNRYFAHHLNRLCVHPGHENFLVKE